MRGSRETPKITAKTGHCPEVDGNRFLIHRVVLPAVPRLHSIQPELVISLRVAAQEFRLVRNWIGTIKRCWLERPHKNDTALRQHPRQCHVFSGVFVPVELGPLHKENFVFVPARHFHCSGLRQRWRFRIDHHSPPQSNEQFIGHQRHGNSSEQKQLISGTPGRVCREDTTNPIVVQTELILGKIQGIAARRQARYQFKRRLASRMPRYRETLREKPAYPPANLPSQNCSRESSPGISALAFRS